MNVTTLSFLRSSLLSMLLLLVVGCGQNEDLEKVRGALEKFRESMAAEEYHQIYVESSSKFREKTSEDLSTKYFMAIDRKLGHHLSSRLAGSRVKWTLRGTRWLMIYKSTFERGEATETFTFTREEGQIRLEGYNIESATLVIN